MGGLILPTVSAQENEFKLLFEIQLGDPTSELNLYSATWSSDETRILVWGGEPSAYIFDAVTGDKLLEMLHITAPNPAAFCNCISNAQWSPDGTKILTGFNQEVKIWDGFTGELLQSIAVPLEVNKEIVFINIIWHADSSKIMTYSSEDRFVRVWDIATGSEIFNIENRGQVFRAEWSPDGQFIATMPLQQDLKDTIAEMSNETKLPEDAGIEDLLEFIAALKFETTLSIWDGTTGEKKFELLHPEAQIHSFTWSADGLQLMTAAGIDWLNIIVSLIAEGIALIEREELFEYSERELDGKSSVRIWNLQTGEIEREILNETTIYAPQWNNDETRIIGSGVDGVVRIWDAATGEILITLKHTGNIMEAIWSADESQIYTFEQQPVDCRILDCMYVWHRWDANTGEHLQDMLVEEQYSIIRRWNWDKSLAIVSHNESEYIHGCVPEDCQHYLMIMDTQGNEVMRIEAQDAIFGEWNSDGTKLLITDRTGKIQAWSIE